ncbi:13947_t:CDS:2, partial [Dentiscutata heterogama]
MIMGKNISLQAFKNELTFWYSFGKFLFRLLIPICIYCGKQRSGWSQCNVAIKSIESSSYNISNESKTSEIFREPIALIVSAISCRNDLIKSNVLKCYGLSKDPNTNTYLIITKLCKCDLWKYLELNFGNIDWFEKLRIVMETANGLKTIHSAGIVHRDFHTGNILVGYDNSIYISDLGLSCYEDKDATNYENTGVFAICNGERPQAFGNVFIPKCYKELMEKCWDNNPSNRPNINELYEILRGWYLAGINANQFKDANNNKNNNVKTINPPKQQPRNSEFISTMHITDDIP